MKKAKINCMADVHAVDVEWLWKPYLPRGKVAAIRYGILSIASTEERMPRTPLRVVIERRFAHVLAAMTRQKINPHEGG